MVKQGDKIPPTLLEEGKPGNKVDLSKELASGKGLIIGVPAAFSPGCSDQHIPGYINHPRLKSAGKVFVVSVNDAFVMNAWAQSLDADQKSGIRFLADADGAFTRALDVEFAAKEMLGTNRSKRYAMRVEDGVIKSVDVEGDDIGISASEAGKILG